MIGIQAAAFYFPEVQTAVYQLPEYHTFVSTNNMSKLAFANLGIETIHDAENASASVLAVRAGKKLFEDNAVKPDDISLIIYLQARSPDFLMSSDVARVQHELGAKRAVCFTLSELGCVDISAALILAKQLMQNNREYKNILILHGSRPVSQRRFRYPVTIIGDGGMALLITHTTQNVIVDHGLEVNGSYWDLFSVDYKKQNFMDWHETCRNLNEYSFNLAIESKNRFSAINDNLLARNNLNYSEIQHFIMQNISQSGFDYYEDIYKIQFNKVCRDNLKKYGHLGSIDIMLNYFDMVAANQCGYGDKVLIMNNSPVAAWSTLFIEA